MQKRGNICPGMDLIPERCKWCSSPAPAGERQSRQGAGTIYLNREPTESFSQHQVERTVRFRGRSDQVRGGGMLYSPALICLLLPSVWKQKAVCEKCEAKGRGTQGVTEHCLPSAAARRLRSREAPSAEWLRASDCRGSHGCTQPFGISLPPCWGPIKWVAGTYRALFARGGATSRGWKARDGGDSQHASMGSFLCLHVPCAEYRGGNCSHQL